MIPEMMGLGKVVSLASNYGVFCFAAGALMGYLFVKFQAFFWGGLMGYLLVKFQASNLPKYSLKPSPRKPINLHHLGGKNLEI